MADKFTAAEAIRRVANLLQPFAEAADMLESMGKIEQAMLEAKTAKDSAVAERDAVASDVEKAKKSIADYKAKGEKIVRDAGDQALATLQEADQKAQSILDGAANKANEMISSAVLEQERQRAPLAGQIAQLTSAKLQLEQDIAALNAATESLRNESDEAQKRLDKIQSAIAKYAAA